MVGIPIPCEQTGLGHAPELKISPLPSKLLAKLHEVPDVFNHESHKKALVLALRERQIKGAGYSKKLNSLFCLWSNRLRENFHTNTYLMFVRLSQEDSLAGDAYGMECLFRFLSYGLERAFRLELFLDFEDLALAQYKRGDLYGVEKYAAFWHYGGKRVLPSSVTPNTQLMYLISEKYPTLSAFKGQRYIERDASFDESQLTASHLGVEVPPSPCGSTFACSEFSFGSPAADDWMMMSSPPASRLSASAPAFTPLGLRRWGGRGLSTDTLPAPSGLRQQSWLTSKPSVPQPVQVSLQVFEGNVAVKISVCGRTTAPMAVPHTQRGFPAAFSGSGNGSAPQAIGSMKRMSRASGSSFSVLGTTPEDRAIDRFPSGVSGGSGPHSMSRPMLVGGAGARASSRNRRSTSEISNSPSALSSSWGGRPGSQRAGSGFGGRSVRSGKKGSVDKGISAWPSGWGEGGGSSAQRWPRGGRPRGGENAWGSRDPGVAVATDPSPEPPAPPDEIAMEVSMGGAVMDEEVPDMEPVAVEGSAEKVSSPQASDLSHTDSSSLDDGVAHAPTPEDSLRRKCNEQA